MKQCGLPDSVDVGSWSHALSLLPLPLVLQQELVQTGGSRLAIDIPCTTEYPVGRGGGREGGREGEVEKRWEDGRTGEWGGWGDGGMGG